MNFQKAANSIDDAGSLSFWVYTVTITSKEKKDSHCFARVETDNKLQLENLSSTATYLSHRVFLYRQNKLAKSSIPLRCWTKAWTMIGKESFVVDACHALLPCNHATQPHGL